MNNNLVPPKICEILKKVVNEDIENFAVYVHDPNKKGEGFLGEMFFVSLKDKSNGKQLDLVVKQAFSNKDIRDFNPIRDVFLNETYFYTELWPKFVKFQERIPSEHRFLHVAKCFATITEENFERLVFENLKCQEFVMHEKKKALEKEKFEFIFKAYGRFHAISFAYKTLKPEEFSEIVQGIFSVWDLLINKKNFEEAIQLTLENCLGCLRPGKDDAINEKYKRYMDSALELFRKSLDNEKYTVVVHGDCWSNNMMFKYNDSEKLIDLKFLDFQLIKLGSPVCDLSYCLYSGGNAEIFSNLDHFLKVYHNSLSESLRAYGCNPDELYPFEALKNDWKVHCHLGIIMGLMIWRGKMTYDGDAVDLTDITDNGETDLSKFFDAAYDKETFNERIRDIVVHLCENSYI